MLGWSLRVSAVAAAIVVGAVASPGSAAARTLQDCALCPLLTVVPTGAFEMGSPDDEPERRASEGPRRTVAVQAFALGVYEVSFSEWELCVAEGGCDGYRPGDAGWGRADRPAIFLSTNDIASYLAWVSARSGQAYRLPTEAEWEYAARAGTDGPFHTGAAITGEQANFNARRTYAGAPAGVFQGRTLPVGAYPPNAFGLHDMHGNVAEWTADCWWPDYVGAPTGASARREGGGADCAQAVVRGGSWLSGGGQVRAAERASLWRDERSDVVGFRVARDVTDAEIDAAGD